MCLLYLCVLVYKCKCACQCLFNCTLYNILFSFIWDRQVSLLSLLWDICPIILPHLWFIHHILFCLSHFLSLSPFSSFLSSWSPIHTSQCLVGMESAQRHSWPANAHVSIQLGVKLHCCLSSCHYHHPSCALGVCKWDYIGLWHFFLHCVFIYAVVLLCSEKHFPY